MIYFIAIGFCLVLLFGYVCCMIWDEDYNDDHH